MPRPPRLLSTRGFGCAACLAVAGCSAGVDPAPFVDYAAATRQLGEGMAAVFAVDEAWTREVFVERLAAGAVDTLELVVSFPDDPDSFAVTLPRPPLFLVVADAAHQMALLDEGLVRYAELLVTLAANEVLTASDVAALAVRLNTAAADLTGGLAVMGVDVPPDLDREQAIVSATAAEALAAYARDRQREALVDAITRNQVTVEAWVAVARDALAIVRDGVQGAYAARKQALVRTLTSGTTARRERAATELADLQAAVVEVMRAIDELREGYARMAAAHLDLGRTLTSERPVLTALAELYAHARRIALVTAELEAARVAGSIATVRAAGGAE